MSSFIHHLLIVDDDARLAAAVARLLETRGFSVTAFSSPREALAAVRRAPHDFDVVLTDLSMPEMNGQDFICAVREIDPRLPIIVSSGAPVDEQTQSRLGVTEVLLKPWRLDEAVEALRRLQERAHLPDDL